MDGENARGCPGICRLVPRTSKAKAAYLVDEWQTHKQSHPVQWKQPEELRIENFTDPKLEIFVPYGHALKLRDEVEVNCQRALLNEALKVIPSVHLCEEPLVNIIPLANHFFDLNGMLGK